MEVCDHRSVGVLITNQNDELLLIERARPPLFWAPPAGHVDAHGSEPMAALEEVNEEVGIELAPNGLIRVLGKERMTNNQCRRSTDGWHEWTVFTALVENSQVAASPDEVKRFAWVTRATLGEMAYNEQYPMRLEPVWTRMLEKLGWLGRPETRLFRRDEGCSWRRPGRSILGCEGQPVLVVHLQQIAYSYSAFDRPYNYYAYDLLEPDVRSDELPDVGGERALFFEQ